MARLLPGSGLVLARAGSARTLLVAAAVTAAVITVLLTAFALYALVMPVAGIRSAIAEADPEERSVLLASGAGGDAAEVAARDRTARELLGGAGVLGGEVQAAGYSSSQLLPPPLVPAGAAGPGGADGADSAAGAVVAFYTDLPERAELVAGAWPEPPAARDAPVPAALPAEVAGELELTVGDEVVLTDARAGRDESPVPLRVVGLWEPVDPSDPYWRLAASPVELGGVGPFVVDRDTFIDRWQFLALLEWIRTPDPAALADAGVARVGEDYRRMADTLARQQAEEVVDLSFRIRSDLGALAERLSTAAVVNRSGMVLPAVLLAVIAGYGLVLLARLLAAHRRGENALLRARGASRRQLVRLHAVEAVLVVAPAALLGAPLGAGLVRLADQRLGDRSLAVAGDLAGYGPAGPPAAWVVALVAAVGCAAALALPAAGRGRTWVAEQQERSRPSRAATVQRAGWDVALVVLAVLAWTQLRQYGSAVAPADAGGLGIDPLLVLAPVVAVLAATALAIRLLPIATRVGVRLAGRRDAFPGLLGMWQADRRPHAGPVLLLVLAVATAVLAPAVATTWQQSQRDQAAQETGADLRVASVAPPQASEAALREAYPEATTVLPVHRAELLLPEGERTTLLAWDSGRAGEVATIRPDLFPDGGPGPVLRDLAQDGADGPPPEVAGAELPAGASRITGRLRFVTPGSTPARMRYFDWFSGQVVQRDVQLPPPRLEDAALHVASPEGTFHSVPLGRLPDPGADGEMVMEFDVSLPAAAASVVGLQAAVSTLGWGGIPTGAELVSDLQFTADPVPVAWYWEELTVVDEAGATAPLAAPDAWRPRGLGEQVRVGPERADGTDPGVTGEVDANVLASHPVLLTDPELRSLPVPVVVTPDVAAATGGQPELSLRALGGGALPTLQVVGVVDGLPGTPDGSGVAVDLRRLAQTQFLQRGPTIAVNEWWVDAPTAGSTEALTTLPWTGRIVDRRDAAQDLLDRPLGTGVLVTLWAAAAAAAVLAAFGLVVDSRATAVRRRRELAVLHTLGASPPGLARALVVEQAVLAGLGVAAGLAVGVGVAAAMGPSLILTELGSVPFPPPVLVLSPLLLAAPTAGLLAVAVVLGAVVARRARREVVAGALRIGED